MVHSRSNNQVTGLQALRSHQAPAAAQQTGDCHITTTDGPAGSIIKENTRRPLVTKNRTSGTGQMTHFPSVHSIVTIVFIPGKEAPALHLSSTANASYTVDWHSFRGDIYQIERILLTGINVERTSVAGELPATDIFYCRKINFHLRCPSLIMETTGIPAAIVSWESKKTFLYISAERSYRRVYSS